MSITRVRRFYDDQVFAGAGDVWLGAAASHHIGRVLRLRPGTPIRVFNGQGGEWDATIQALDKRGVQITVESFRAEDRTASISVTLLLPLLKGERMDYALQKATELGASAFQLVHAQHSDVRLDEARLSRKLDHWQQVLVSACEQCGMNRLPVLHPPVPLPDALLHLSADNRIMGDPSGPSLRDHLACDISDLSIATGPEGGFSDGEHQALEAAGFLPVALGDRVLRAETAPVALLAAALALRG